MVLTAFHAILEVVRGLMAPHKWSAHIAKHISKELAIPFLRRHSNYTSKSQRPLLAQYFPRAGLWPSSRPQPQIVSNWCRRDSHGLQESNACFHHLGRQWHTASKCLEIHITERLLDCHVLHPVSGTLVHSGCAAWRYRLKT
jgi:hypothetical protein